MTSPDGIRALQPSEPDEGDGLPTALLSASRLLDTEFLPISFAIPPYFPREELTELSGAHGIFKSTAALDACLSVATDRTWGGMPVMKGRAVFITMEDGERTLHYRLRAWLEGVSPGEERSDAEADLRENFVYLPREDARGLALTTTDRTGTAERTSVVVRLVELIADAVLVVLETTARLHEGPEMNEAFAVFAQAVERIAIESGAAVCIVRHVGKEAARQSVVDSYAGRGGGALSDAARSVLVMTRDRKEDEDGEEDPLAPVRLTHAKSTHAPKGSRIVWKPVKCENGVFLRVVPKVEETRDEAALLLAHIQALGDAGVTRSDLHKKPPAGLARGATTRAMEALTRAGEVEQREERRGRTNQNATVYRAARRTP